MSPPRPRKDAAPEAAPAPVPFEERLKALEAVVADLEGEDLSLEDALRRYREGVEHLRACRALLDDAEARLAELVAETGPDGEPRVVERPLQVTEKGLSAADEGAPSRKARGGDAGPSPGRARADDDVPV